MAYWRRGRADHIRRRIAAEVKAEEPNCWLCNKPINPDLTWPHPWSFSVDHVEPVVLRPDLEYVRSNCRSAHLRHNQQRGDGRRRRPSKQPVQPFMIQGEP